MTSDILCRGSYPSSPGSGTTKLSLQCRNCRIPWKRFLDIIFFKVWRFKRPRTGVRFPVRLKCRLFHNIHAQKYSNKCKHFVRCHRNPVAKTAKWPQYSWRSAFWGRFSGPHNDLFLLLEYLSYHHRHARITQKSPELPYQDQS